MHDIYNLILVKWVVELAIGSFGIIVMLLRPDLIDRLLSWIMDRSGR